jgi:non-ribosomal peptide synthetase component E (peptide arylation enzyme)
MRNFAWRLRYSFSSALQARLATQREAVRFEAQNISWTQQELNYHSDAVARGLRALGLQSGDKLMLKLSPGLQSEIITSRLAAARLGAEIVRSKASTSQDFATELQDKKPAGVIFDPTLKLGEGTLGDQLSRQFPTLNKCNS